jgi:hypothetical protein
MLHCHVNQHSDTGVAALLEVAADPDAQGPLDEPTFLRLGSCPAVRFGFDSFSLKFALLNTFTTCNATMKLCAQSESSTAVSVLREVRVLSLIVLRLSA